MTIAVYHNPDCGTSRNVLRIIEAAGIQPVVIEYLGTGWTRAQLIGLFAAADITPHQALRTGKSPAEELGLLDRVPMGPVYREDGEAVIDADGQRMY